MGCRTSCLTSRAAGARTACCARPRRSSPTGATSRAWAFFPPDAAVLCESRARDRAGAAAGGRAPDPGHAARRGQRDDRRRAAGARRHRAVDRAHEADHRRSSVDDRIAVVEPGVINGDLQAAVEAQGLFYPPDPASLGVLLDGRQRRRERGRAARVQVRRHARLDAGPDVDADGRRDAAPRARARRRA